MGQVPCIISNNKTNDSEQKKLEADFILKYTTSLDDGVNKKKPFLLHAIFARYLRSSYVIQNMVGGLVHQQTQFAKLSIHALLSLRQSRHKSVINIKEIRAFGKWCSSDGWGSGRRYPPWGEKINKNKCFKRNFKIILNNFKYHNVPSIYAEIGCIKYYTVVVKWGIESPCPYLMHS